MKNVVVGALAIIIGLIVMAFPLLGVIAASIISGFLVLSLGIWLLIAGISEIGTSKAAGILNLIVGILAVILGFGLIFSPYLFSFLAGFLLYLAGIFLIVAGIIALLVGMEKKYSLWGGVLGIILGILYIILGTYAFHPVYLGILIGVWLVITGIFKLFEKDEMEEVTGMD